MKSILKSFALCAAALAATACSNEYEDFDKYHGNPYPESVPYGNYESVEAVDGYTYNVVVTESAAGERVVNVVRTAAPDTEEAGMVRTLVVAPEASYDDTTGAMVAAAEDSYFESPATTTLVYKNDRRSLYMEFAYGRKRITTTLVPTTAAPTLAGNWEGQVNENISFGVMASAPDAEGNGTAVVTINGQEAGEARYTFVNGTGTVTFADQDVALAYNEKLQLTASFAGQTFILDRLISEPEPEHFIPIYKGIMTHGVQDLSTMLGAGQPWGCIFEGASYDAVLAKSDKVANSYAIVPFLNLEEGLQFTLNADGSISIPAQGTLVGSQYGEIMVSDINSYFGQTIIPCQYDEATSTFDLFNIYFVSVGAMAVQYETFQLVEPVEAGLNKTLLQRVSPKQEFKFLNDRAPRSLKK